MANKKNVVATAANLQTKSDTAIAAFRNLIAGLKTTNEEAEAAKAANEAQIRGSSGRKCGYRSPF